MARNVNVLYSKARVRKGDLRHPTLEQALRSALNTRINGVLISTDASLRRSDAALDYGSLVINYVDILRHGIFIEVVRFAPGSQIPLIQTGSGGSEYALQNANTPRGTELIRGFLYALVYEDHFIYVNREIAMNRTEDFTEWMLSQKTQTATQDLSLNFAAEVNVEALPSVQRMVLRPREAADSRPVAPRPQHDGGSVSTRAAAERLTGSSVFDILKAAHFTNDRIAALEAQGVDIELKLEVFFKSDGSRHEISRHDVADLIRDVPEKELTLYSKSGRERSGHIKRLAFTAEVETVGELYDRPSIVGALWEAYRYFGKEGYL